ncbi:hypothetical protein AAL_02839 [Moelleriella libera RCEF 2490]|uniref:Uncharacterized protein n=1 Tax=Moelleriella libera RCEF 2490 TaxID=1081109 RepID=A0A168E1F7_9HYPO|nr:hypothetical protein AAL_02839 [Moelleriella libera RCEF 2490]
MAAADNDNTTGGGDSFKPQLDQAAIDQRNRDADTKPNPIVEKITEFIPAASKILAPKEPATKQEAPPVPGPPERPAHDPQIEGFVREQHGSKQPGGDLSSVAQ